jgi:hypothetical protein
MVKKNLAKSEIEDGTWKKLTSTTTAHKSEGKSLILLQVNCRAFIINY